MPALRLWSVTVHDGTISYDYSATGRLDRFFTAEPFFAAYEEDVAHLPESILTIPWLANVCPVAWAAGADVTVPRLDAEFRDALYRVQEGMADLYPDLIEGGEVRGELVVDPSTAPGPERDRGNRTDGFDDSALLFSGGVDSLTTYVRHRGEEPYLVSIAGADLDSDNREAWRRNRAIVEEFAAERDLEALFVETDMHSFLDGNSIRAHYQRYLDNTWWASVQHGLGLLGLCAPLTYARGIGDLYIAATHTAEFDEPWGSHPAIDDEVAWTGTTAHHDGYDLSRQGKLEVLADYVEREAPDLTIRACHESAAGGNCNRCEKCARTIVGLLLAGLDPERRGYELAEETFETFRDRLESGAWRLGADERFMWADLQAHVDLDRGYPQPDARPFLAWLESADLDEIVARSSDAALGRYARRIARELPYPLVRPFVPVYARLRRLLG